MPYAVVETVWMEFVGASTQAATKEELLASHRQAMHSLGFNHINVSLIRDFDLPESEMAFGLTNTYPDDWRLYYLDRDCVRFDPVAQLARGYVSPFYWNDVGRLIDLNPLQTSFLNLAEEAGLHNGIGLPFSGAHTLIGGVALATSSKSDEHLKDLNLLWSFSSLLHRRLKEIILDGSLPASVEVALTVRELDILNLIVQGLHDRTIGRHLGISENTVNSHLRHIYRKFGVQNRIQAVCRAVRLGLVNPT